MSNLKLNKPQNGADSSYTTTPKDLLVERVAKASWFYGVQQKHFFLCWFRDLLTIYKKCSVYNHPQTNLFKRQMQFTFTLVSFEDLGTHAKQEVIGFSRLMAPRRDNDKIFGHGVSLAF